MQFTIATLTALVAAALAAPGGYGGGSGEGGGNYNPCTGGLQGTMQCCGSLVGGLVGVDCQQPYPAPTSATSFQTVCEEAGKTPACCVLNVIGLGAVCEKPAGTL